MTDTSIPSSAFESLLPKLLATLELTQQESTSTPQAKQALLHATNDFKASLSRAKGLANALPGGELLIEEQDEVIAMLERLRDKKRHQLNEFTKLDLKTPAQARPGTRADRMDIDSTASTPA
ncbi:uncharacterized protein STEHIDRAFT_151370 [Stereum hirsutum FP-91666 SS1]|uniref:uncharacterized protein n=1 Tax=Stereum hirsutum (strain FP-91666) TaxID=721885 RepID=UPI000440B634|nr:uncharacterized protein STEHIDRAFT_151370 [Stereum hirsutum FP-91666 SS1]EIM92020.1 hypothetical protein STEHIDRAFT_151370 [Stereum hirsutum FP-91666 SS1]